MTIDFNTLTAGQTLLRPDAFKGTDNAYTVVSNDGAKIVLTNPDAGRNYGHAASPATLTYKTTSPRLAAIMSTARVA